MGWFATICRGAPLGEASRGVAADRNRRVQPQPSGQDLEEARADRARKRAAAGGIVLPGRYKRVQVRMLGPPAGFEPVPGCSGRPAGGTAGEAEAVRATYSRLWIVCCPGQRGPPALCLVLSTKPS